MRLQVVLDKNIDKFQNQLKLAMQGELAATIEAGTKLAAEYLIKEIITRIRDGRYEKLSPLTLLLKRFDGYGEIPLIRTGALIRSINKEMKAYNTAQVGLLLQRKKSGRNGGPDSFENIGKILHDGAVIKVTEKMRIAFARRLAAIERKAGVTLNQDRPGSGAGVIRIKPRPFIKDVFEDPKVIAEVEKIFTETFQKKLGLLKL